MSFYQTSNSTIARFSLHDPAKKAIAPFRTIKRIAQTSYVGGGYSGYYTGTNTNYFLTPEQIQNGALIVTAIGINTGTGQGGVYTLPSAYALQEYLGGRGAFNILNGNLLSQQNTGVNDYFILNVYNLSTNTGNVVAYDNASAKQISAASISGDAVKTPVLIQFNGVNSTIATTSTTTNYVSYTLI